MQNIHPVKHLSMPTSKKLFGMGAEVDSQLSHISKIVYFIKLDNDLILTVYPKIFTRRLTVLLEAPNFTNVDIASYNLYKISCLGSRVILRQL